MDDECLDFDPVHFDKPCFPLSIKRDAPGKSSFSSSSRNGSSAQPIRRRGHTFKLEAISKNSTGNIQSSDSISLKSGQELSSESSSNDLSVSNSTRQSLNRNGVPCRPLSVTTPAEGSLNPSSQTQSSHDETITTVASSLHSVQSGVEFDGNNKGYQFAGVDLPLPTVQPITADKTCNTSVATGRSQQIGSDPFSSQNSSQSSLASDYLSNTVNADGRSKFAVSKSARNANRTFRISQRSKRSEWLSEDVVPQESAATMGRDASSMANVRKTSTFRTDVLATKDAGNAQFFRDEVIWCCSNIVGHSKTEKIKAAMDLAILVSDKVSSPSHTAAEAFLNDDVATALVDVISFCKTLQSSEAPASDDEEAKDEEGEPNEFKRLIVTTLHFLAVACCDQQNNRRLVRNVSQRNLSQIFLSSSEAMLGIMYLVLADPRLSILLGRKHRSYSTLGFEHVPVSVNNPSTPSSQTTVSSAPTPESVGTCSESASLALSCSDPTRAGRLNRNKKRRIVFGTNDLPSPLRQKKHPQKMESHGGVDNSDDLSFTIASGKDEKANYDKLAFKDQESRLPSRAHKKIASVFRSVAKSVGVPCNAHSCGHDSDVWLEELPLLALSRIINRKLGFPPSIGTQSSEDVEVSTFGAPKDTQVIDNVFEGRESDCVGDDEPSDAKCNPVLSTNVQLGESGVIPLLSTALADTLLAASKLLSRTCRRRPRQKSACPGCLSHLLRRVRILVSIIDGASLFCVSNRVKFCQAGYTVDLGGYLIVGLATALSKIAEADMLFEGTWGEFVLEILRTLTSLTHENKLAGKELEAVMPGNGKSCLNVLGELLHRAVTPVDESVACSDDKQKYDCSILCMNIFTNYLESGGSRDRLEGLQVQSSGYTVKSCLFLPWFTQWVVAETASFRDALMDISFGTSPSKHAKRTLQEKEDEKLVAAGNGFILLACLIIKNDGETASKSEGGPDRIRATVSEHLPGSDFPSKLTFMKNALKVFCNFYHASVGDLSLAIVDPVQRLIQHLDEMSNAELKDDR